MEVVCWIFLRRGIWGHPGSSWMCETWSLQSGVLMGLSAPWTRSTWFFHCQSMGIGMFLSTRMPVEWWCFCKERSGNTEIWNHGNILPKPPFSHGFSHDFWWTHHFPIALYWVPDQTWFWLLDIAGHCQSWVFFGEICVDHRFLRSWNEKTEVLVKIELTSK